MPSFLAPVDLNGNELRNTRIQNLGTDPATPGVGQLWYDTAADALKVRTAAGTTTLTATTNAVAPSLFDANTVLKADADNTPVALTVGASTILGRAATGGIDALAPAAARTVLGLGSLATLSTITSANITDGTIVDGDINASAGIALTKLATQAASTIVGNATAGAATPTALTAAQAKTLLAITTGDVSGLGTLATLNTITSTNITDGTITNVDINASAGIALSKLATDPLARANHTGTQLAATISDFDTAVRTSRLDQLAAPTSPLGLNAQRITNVGTPTADTDAATKAYVDSTAQGLDIKGAVRVATTGNINLAAPGAAIDGVTLANGDRVLVKDQTTANQNGIYTFTGAATAMTRAADANTSSEVNAGMFTFVSEGTANGDKSFVLTTNNPITLGTTGLTFTQFAGSGSVTGTANRITVTGTQVDIAADYTGQNTITTLGTVTTGTWNGTAIAVARGGTGATTAAAARTNLGATAKYATAIGNGSATSFTVTHNLNTEDVQVELYDATSKTTVYADVTRASANTVTIGGFITAPATNGLRVVVVG